MRALANLLLKCESTITSASAAAAELCASALGLPSELEASGQTEEAGGRVEWQGGCGRDGYVVSEDEDDVAGCNDECEDAMSEDGCAGQGGAEETRRGAGLRLIASTGVSVAAVHTALAWWREQVEALATSSREDAIPTLAAAVRPLSQVASNAQVFYLPLQYPVLVVLIARCLSASRTPL